MIRKLTEMQAQDVILKAQADVQKAPTMRFGQAIWNHSPNDLTTMFAGTEGDFYEETDAGAACHSFFKYFVQPEVLEGLLSNES